jgi:hypothetical protein
VKFANEDMPTKLQKKVIAEISRNGNDVKQAMLDVGYSESSANRELILKSKYVGSKVVQYFPVDYIAKQVDKLFKGGKVESFKIAKDAGVKELSELKAVLESRGMSWLGIQKTPMGTFAFYIDDDRQAIAKGADMYFKLSGEYASEKIEISTPPPIVGMRIVDDVVEGSEQGSETLSNVQNDATQGFDSNDEVSEG